MLSVTPRNRIENIISFELIFHQNKSIRKSIRITVLSFWKFWYVLLMHSKLKLIMILPILVFISAGEEINELPKVFNKFSKEEFGIYVSLLFAYGFGCSGMLG